MKQRGLAAAIARVAAVLLGAAAMPQTAAAHPGDMHGLIAGLMHPLSGVDHLIAMLALGCWAAMRWDESRWVMPLAALLGVAAGSGAALFGPALQLIESAALSTVVALGLLICLRSGPVATAAAAIAVCFGAVHGYAHAAQIPPDSAAWSVISGFLLTSSLLQLTGLLLCKAMLRRNLQPLMRAAGACIALGGALALVVG